MSLQVETEQLTVLLIEDSHRDGRLVQELLSEQCNALFRLEWVDTLSKGMERIERGGVDVILLDLSLPDSEWTDTFFRVRTKAHKIPIVVLTGTDGDSLCLKTIQERTEDFLKKRELDHFSLINSLCYAMERKIKDLGLENGA